MFELIIQWLRSSIKNVIETINRIRTMGFASQHEEFLTLSRTINFLQEINATNAIVHIENLRIKEENLKKVAVNIASTNLEVFIEWTVKENDRRNYYTSYISIDQPGSKPGKPKICKKCGNHI